MKRRTRRLLLAAVVAFFIIATPFVLLYATGFSFDFSAKKFVKTGGFYFKSNPSKAEIFINDKLRGKTSKYIRRMIPKEYEIKIQKEGCWSWEKKLNIESHLVTEARNILLIPQNPKIELEARDLPVDFSIEEYLAAKEPEAEHFLLANSKMHAGYAVADQDIYFVQKSDYLLYKSNLDGSSKQPLSEAALPKEKEYQIFAGPQPAVLADDNKLYLSNEDNIFELIALDVIDAQFAHDNKKLLYLNQNEIWVMYLEEIQTQPYHLKDDKELITRLSKPISKALWYSATNEHIIFSVNGHIKVAELDGRDKRNIVDFIAATPEKLYYSHQDEKLYYTENRQLYSTQLEKSNGLF